MTISSVRRTLGETLFQDPSAKKSDMGRASALLILGGLFVLAMLLQMLRVGWSVSLHSLWAEDGAVYFSGAVHSGFGGSLFDTYADLSGLRAAGDRRTRRALPLAGRSGGDLGHLAAPSSLSAGWSSGTPPRA